ncbi:MAG TPA: DUF4833 domain-containing protein [Bacteroides sp.]|nr:DUF4833 domain-containing protein [Bacteroides sp.]
MRKSQVIIILLILGMVVSGFSDPDINHNYAGDYNLFEIERSRDADVVMYDVNLDSSGNLDAAKPISIYWKKHTESGRLAAITSIQKKFGYGIKIQDLRENTVDFEIVSYKDQVFQLRKTFGGRYRVFTSSQGKEIEVTSLYIKFEDDSFWFPTVSRVEVQGIDTDRGSQVSETITAFTK